SCLSSSVKVPSLSLSLSFLNISNPSPVGSILTSIVAGASTTPCVSLTTGVPSPSGSSTSDASTSVAFTSTLGNSTSDNSTLGTYTSASDSSASDRSISGGSIGFVTSSSCSVVFLTISSRKNLNKRSFS